MAVPSDPNFGSGFNADKFKNSIKSAMQMGAPNNVEERVTFKWPVHSTYTGKTDPSGRPYDLHAAAASTTEVEDVQVDCAVEFTHKQPDGTPIGEFNHPRVKITLLDDDYQQIEGATQVLLGGNLYNIQFVEPPVGLFSVTVYYVHAIAQDES